MSLGTSICRRRTSKDAERRKRENERDRGERLREDNGRKTRSAGEVRADYITRKRTREEGTKEGAEDEGKQKTGVVPPSQVRVARP